MDLNTITTVASRKRMSIEAEKLREKVSRETAKILKLKVAQDTAYWDLKEKLQQVESNHEKLQQNMVEVQMQHEAISGQYQEELRLRPDTLNKVSSTREMCGVLQAYSERLRATVSRCAADQAALGEAYQRSGQLLRDLCASTAAEADRARDNAKQLQERVQQLSSHQSQLVQVLSAAQQQLAAGGEREAELRAARDALTRDLERCGFDIKQKEEMYENLQADMKKMMQESNGQAAEARAALAGQANELKELREENQSLKQAVEHQEQFSKSVCDQNGALQEKLAAAEDELVALRHSVQQLRAESQEAAAVNTSLQNNVASLNDDKQSLLMQIQDTAKNIHSLEEELKCLHSQYVKLESEKNDLGNELNATIEESNRKGLELQTLSTAKAELENIVSQLENAFKNHRDATDENIKKLNASIEAKENELDSKAGTINQLMCQLKTSSEVRAKLEGTLQKVKKEMDIERDAVKEREHEMTNTISKLEISVRDKDDELSKQMSIILEMRNEKERLQQKIQSMQNTIDNIQKELTRPRAPTAPCLQPELDDNAVNLTPLSTPKPPSEPSHQQPQPLSPPQPRPVQFAVPRAHEPDAMLYSLFSDSSMEGDALDMSEVNRRFSALARGERLSPAPLSALKRRGGMSARPSHDTQISLSQVKNDLKKKERTFFKNKRLDSKFKKAK